MSLQHVSISEYLVGRSDRASFERAALEHGRVSSWSYYYTAAVWRRNPAGGDDMFQGVCSIREKQKYILPGLGLTKLVFFCEFVERQGKSSLKGEGFLALQIKYRLSRPKTTFWCVSPKGRDIRALMVFESCSNVFFDAYSTLFAQNVCPFVD